MSGDANDSSERPPRVGVTDGERLVETW